MKYIAIETDVYHITNKDYDELDKLEIGSDEEKRLFDAKLAEIQQKYKLKYDLSGVFNY